MDIYTLFTYLPGIAFPLSYILNIMAMMKHNSAKGANPWSFFAYFIANLAAFLFVGIYDDWRTIAAFLVTGLLEFLAVFFALKYNKHISENIKILIYIISLISILLTVYLFFYKRKLVYSLASAAGYVTAVIFPVGTWFMYKAISQTEHPVGASLLAWILQFLGNFGGYFLAASTRGYMNVKAISGFLVTAFINILIIHQLIIKKNTLI